MKADESMIVIEYLYDNKHYQKIVLLLACLIWGLLDIFSLSLGLIELKPVVEVKYKNDTIIYTGLAKYEYCYNEHYTLNILDSPESSLVSYYKIYCDKYLVAMIGSANFLGVLIGTLISPILVDFYSRKKLIITGLGMFSLILVLTTFSPNIIVILIFIFLSGIFNLISHITVFLLINEVTRNEKKAKYSSIIFNSVALFGVIISMEFYYIENWKYIFYFHSLCIFVVLILIICFLKESPRFLLIKEDTDKLGKIRMRMRMLRRIFNYTKEYVYYAEQYEENKRKRLLASIENENSLGTGLAVSLLDGTSEELEIDKAVLDNLNSGCNQLEPYSSSNANPNPYPIPYPNFSLREKPAMMLITNPGINYIFIIMCFMWFSISGTYYGLLILTKDANRENVYSSFALLYILEMFSNGLVKLIMEHPEIGRKKLFIFLYSVAIIYTFSYCIYDYSNNFSLFITTLRFLVSVIYTNTYVYTIEIYPTGIRDKALAINIIIGRLSSIFVPLLIEVLGEKSFILCLVVFLINFVLSCVLKEKKFKE